MRVDIAANRKQVTWMQRTGFTSDSTSNQQIPAFTSQGTFYAAVIPLTADERIWAQAQQSLVTHKVVMRYIGDVREHDRLTYTRYTPTTSYTATLEIASVIDTEERHRELTLLCKEVR